MTTSRFRKLGANSKAPALLPALQASRAADPDVRKSIEAIREWLEVRLGSRGDDYERAVTLRDLDQALAPIRDLLDSYGDFSGTLDFLTLTNITKLPALRDGAFARVNDELYWCNGKAWKKVTLT